MDIKKRNTLAVLLAGFSTVAFAGEISPENIPGSTLVDAAQAKALFDSGAAFIDVRKDSDYEAGRVPGAIHLELKSIYSPETLADEVEKDEEIVIYCNGHKCLRSAVATEKAVKWGFSKVYYFRDGLPGWKAAGYAVE